MPFRVSGPMPKGFEKGPCWAQLLELDGKRVHAILSLLPVTY